MSNDEQIEYWNGRAGRKWADQAEQLDSMLSEFCSRLVSQLSIKDKNCSVLDVGCGAGAVSLALAKNSPNPNNITGVDVSKPLLEVARQRAKNENLPVNYLEADASMFRMDSGVEVIVSRFGVMFFDDPVSAFANLQRLITKNGKLVFVCWQSIKLNSWASAPMRAAIPLLKEPFPTPDPYAPGPFAFADKERLNSILRDAGWNGISIESINTKLRLPGSSIDESAIFMMTLGPLARVMAEQQLDEELVKTSLIELLSQNQNANGEIWMEAASWLVVCD